MEEQKGDAGSSLIENDTSCASMSQQTVGTQTTIYHSEDPTNSRETPRENQNGSGQNPRRVSTVLQTSGIEGIKHRIKIVLRPKTDSTVSEKQLSDGISNSTLQPMSGQSRENQTPAIPDNGGTAPTKQQIIYITPSGCQLQLLKHVGPRMPSLGPVAHQGPRFNVASALPASNQAPRMPVRQDTPQGPRMNLAPVSHSTTQGPRMIMASVHQTTPQGPRMNMAPVRQAIPQGPRMNMAPVFQATTQGPRMNMAPVRQATLQGPRMNMAQIQQVSIQRVNTLNVRQARPPAAKTPTALFPFARPQLFTSSQLVPVPQTQWLYVQGSKRSLLVPQQYVATSPMNIRPQLAVTTASNSVPAPGNEYVKVRLQGNRSGPEFVLIPKACAPQSPPLARKIPGPRGKTVLEANTSASSDQHQQTHTTGAEEAMDTDEAGSDETKSTLITSVRAGLFNLQNTSSTNEENQTSSFPVPNGRPCDIPSNMKLLGSLSAENTAILAQYFKSSSANTSATSVNSIGMSASTVTTPALTYSSTALTSSATFTTRSVPLDNMESAHESGASSEAAPEAKDKGVANCIASNKPSSDVTTLSMSPSTNTSLEADTPSTEPRVRSTAPTRKNQTGPASRTLSKSDTGLPYRHHPSQPSTNRDGSKEGKSLSSNEVCQHPKEKPLTETSQTTEYPEMSDDNDATSSKSSSSDVASQDLVDIDNAACDMANSCSSGDFSLKDYKGPVDMYVYLPMSAFKKGAVTYMSINKCIK